MKYQVLPRLALIFCGMLHTIAVYSAREPMRIHKILINNVLSIPVEVKVAFSNPENKTWYLKMNKENYITLDTARLEDRSIIVKMPRIEDGIKKIHVTVYGEKGIIASREIDYQEFRNRYKKSIAIEIQRGIRDNKPKITIQEWGNTTKVQDWATDVNLMHDVESTGSRNHKSPIERSRDYKVF